MLIGVLGLQGDVKEHQAMLESLGAQTRIVKSAEDLADLNGIVLPGGESTAQSKLLQIFNLLRPLREAIDSGLPTLGTCAGLILLASKVSGLVKGQELLALLDVEVERNAYGAQLESFESTVSFNGGVLRAAFIRAPKILNSRNAEVLAEFNGNPVIVKQKNIIGATCHPEISGDTALHEYFLATCR